MALNMILNANNETTAPLAEAEDLRERWRIRVQGTVQGIGFRPFVYRRAREERLGGWILNDTEGVLIEVEGSHERLKRFLSSLSTGCPSTGCIQYIESQPIERLGESEFKINPSQLAGRKSTSILPDLAMCDECRRDIEDPRNRRFEYPFTNCTHCGPRFSIIEGLPYDRARTSMRDFEMCPECRKEYENPEDRRFHAQPVACPRCGPRLELWDRKGGSLAVGDDALEQSAELIREGAIVAVKGLGGFHLVALASRNKTVRLLRQRKQREGKPFALMFPDLNQIREVCEVSPREEALLLSTSAPIVLLLRKDFNKPGKAGSIKISEDAAPGNPRLGVMLPYTPLHHLLLRRIGEPVVATSGNLSEEPICTDNDEAVFRLKQIADAFLVHDRPIVRPVEDSVAKVFDGQPMLLRRSRGYAPSPIRLDACLSPSLSVGAHLKNAIAIGQNRDVCLSQHHGDLETTEASKCFAASIADLSRIYEIAPRKVACDLHPDYLSTHYAESMNLPVIRVQHHLAHAYSCMAEHHLAGRTLAVVWDGTGYGTDGTIWGGECFLIDGREWKRCACFQPFSLPGGEAAIRSPARQAVGVLHALFEDLLFEPFLSLNSSAVRRLLSKLSEPLQSMLKKQLTDSLNCPQTTSAGRLFDAASALSGLCLESSYEGEAAVLLEAEAMKSRDADAYDYTLHHHDASEPVRVDWTHIFVSMLHDLNHRLPLCDVARRFHNTLCRLVFDLATLFEEKQVVLSGGCFQNDLLLEGSVRLLGEAGFHCYWNQQTPINDGGIALGQMYAMSLETNDEPIKQNSCR